MTLKLLSTDTKLFIQNAQNSISAGAPRLLAGFGEGKGKMDGSGRKEERKEKKREGKGEERGEGEVKFFAHSFFLRVPLSDSIHYYQFGE